MDINTVYRNILKFAIAPIDYSEFITMLKSSSASEPILCWYTTEEGNNRRYTMWWDSSAYVGTQASLTKEDNDMYNLQGDYPGGDWRTLDTLTVSRIKFKNKTYIIR
jgi:hypothetical protein